MTVLNKDSQENQSTKRTTSQTVLLSIIAIFIILGGYIMLRLLDVDKADGRERALRELLTIQFSTAEEALIQALESPDSHIMINDNGNIDLTNDTPLNQYLDGHYRMLLTDSYYDEYIVRYLLSYPVFAYYNDIDLNISNITIEKQEAEGDYHFTVHVDDGDDQQGKVTGRAHVTGDGQISFLDIFEDDTLFLNGLY
ncbi:hypothetical protein HMI01_18460 [Halolactibacillus miurensis]|uniref:Uncharacterized protein n=1 Tax=Halolactibacillus miurensis TaxID=306541 RepID=A0A1I6TZQ0_9BACI|nr:MULTISPECIES: hypothetical protein [Halolactibacillus]GEM04858.1 hypothetical protein HMI01_18460 [Halolactibacillus miurensis]SFS94645.1 hypothetical protein SAMN05421668_1204 [Halolactibacillus miurensis]